MKINSISSNAFKGVHVVRVSKDVFDSKSDSDLTEQFNDMACNTLDRVRKVNLIDKIGLFFETTKSAVFYDALESPGHDAARELLSNNPLYKNTGVSWLSMHTKMPITAPESEEYHKFYILTGEEKNKIFKAFNWFNTKKLQIRASRSYEKTGDKNMDTLKEYARLTKILDEKFHEIIDGKPVTEWEAKTPEELDDVFEKIYKLND